MLRQSLSSISRVVKVVLNEAGAVTSDNPSLRLWQSSPEFPFVRQNKSLFLSYNSHDLNSRRTRGCLFASLRNDSGVGPRPMQNAAVMSFHALGGSGKFWKLHALPLAFQVQEVNQPCPLVEAYLAMQCCNVELRSLKLDQPLPMSQIFRLVHFWWIRKSSSSNLL